MSTKRFTYELFAKDSLSGKLKQISNVSTGTYNKLIGGQSRFNDKIRQGGDQVNTMRSRLTGMIGTYLTLGAGIMVARNSMQKWDAQVQAEAQVMQGIKSTNMAAGKSFDDLTKAASELQKKTLFGDETILQNVSAQILTFSNITGTAFDKTQQAALDITSRLYGANASGESLRSTSIMLGKALNDPIKNLGALSRSGAQFSEEQQELIKNLWKTGETAKAQEIMLAELEKQYGGSAEAAAKAGMGPWKQFMNTIGDIQEKLGPGLNKIALLFKETFDWIQSNIEIIKPLVFVIGSAVAAYYAWIGVMKVKAALMVTYKALQFGFIAITQGWTAAQTALNVALTANPIGLIIAGIAVLGTAIYAIIQKTKGWGEQWQNFKDVVSNLWDRLKLKFESWVGNLTLLWQKFKKALGLGSDEDVAATEKKLFNIGNKLNDLQKNAPQLEWKMKWDSSGKLLPDWASNLLGGSSSNGSSTGTGNGYNDMNSVLTGNDDIQSGINGITSGGKGQTVINITLGKLQEYTQITANTVQEGIDDMEAQITEALLRVLNSANKIATQ